MTDEKEAWDYYAGRFAENKDNPRARYAESLWADIGYAARFIVVPYGEDGSYCSCDWMLYNYAPSPPPLFGEDMFSGPHSQSMETATPSAWGFTKWTGCMQWDGDFHVDDDRDLQKLCEALQRVRRDSLAMTVGNG